MANSKEKRLTNRKVQSMANVLIATAMLLLFSFYANLRWANEAPAFEKAKRTADTPAYVRISGEDFFSKDFWADNRPPVFPLVLKIYAADTTKVAAFQATFSIFAWGMLALAVSYSLKNILRPFAFGLILALSLDRHIAGWDLVMLTESLSISLMALFLASWLWLLKNWSWGKVIVLSLVAFLWAFTRDTNGWILLMIAGLMLTGVLFFGARKRYLSVAVVFILIFALSNFSANEGNRWVFPFQNVLAQRILPDQEALAFFSDCGMPVTSELLNLAEGYANSNDRAFYTDPALQTYRDWLKASGKSCYMRWLFSKPLTSLRQPWVDFGWLLAFEDVASFYPQLYEPALPWYVERLLYPQGAILWLWALTSVAALVAIWKKAWKVNSTWVVFIGLCLLIYPHVFIVWHGDVSGTHRHALTVSVQLMLGLWFFWLSLSDWVTRTDMQRTWKHKLLTIKSDYLWWGVILLGIFLRLRQYFLNRSLWADEASLAMNVVTRSFGELTQLLDYHQAAPIGFLFIEKLSIVIFGNHDYIMRLFPLISGSLAVYLIYKIARVHFGMAGLFAVIVFAITWWLVIYSSELKQYSSDVMAALLLVFFAGNCLKENIHAKDFLLLGITGTIAIWISHPSVFMLAGIGLVLVLEKFTRKEYVPWAWILGIGIGWLASFGLEYLVSLRHIVADEYLIKYWRRAYVPLPPWSDKGWYLSTYYSFVFFAFHRADNIMALSTLVLTAIGAITILGRDWKVGLLVISPFVMVVIASALQRYPLKDRFMLFLIPFALLLMAEGFRGIYWLIAKWKPGFAAVISVILALVLIWQIAPITFEKAVSGAKEDIRLVIAYVAENRAQDDIVYIFHKTDPVFHYYAPFYSLDTGNIIIGVYSPKKSIALQNFENDVDRLIGNKRVWFVFSELVDCVDCEGEGTQAFYLNHINKFGVMIDSFTGSGGNAYLYDLSP